MSRKGSHQRGSAVMEVPDFMHSGGHRLEVKAVDMHTCGEPTRIVFDGFPDMSGTLLEQRQNAIGDHDHIRKALLQEPRGHPDMYGAVILRATELTGKTPRVDLGVLFLTNEGYSTMCGHATIAIGRLLADHVGSRSFQLLPDGRLDNLQHDLDDKKEVYLHLHAPCGVVHITVPVVLIDPLTVSTLKALPRWRTDPDRPTSYLSVPSFATGISVSIRIPRTTGKDLRWPELEGREQVTVDIAYGGAFYIIVRLRDLGFNPHCLSNPGMLLLPRLKEAVHRLRLNFSFGEENEHLNSVYLRHPEHRELEKLYGIIVTGFTPREDRNDGLSLCVFANSQVDRSPTGSGVQARIALAYAKGEIGLNETRTYHSPVSDAFYGDHAFTGAAVEEVDAGGDRQGVIVKVGGFARYTGCSTFIVEDGDRIGEGFVFDTLAHPSLSSN